MADGPRSDTERQLIEIYRRSSPDHQAFIRELLAAISTGDGVDKAIEMAPLELRSKLFQLIQH